MLAEYYNSPPKTYVTEYQPKKQLYRGYSTPCVVLKPVHFTFKNAERSCLKPLDLESQKSKKKVVFADDKGLALEHVKIMTEPSHVPPQWCFNLVSSPVIEKVEPVVDLWETKFSPPASDYVEFRRKITEDCVALENVIIKQKEGALDGTVKVKNIDFSKEVLVRSTADGWRTNEDTSCVFIESGPEIKGVSLYDTFGFRIQLPIHSRRLDFCVCFRCDGKEFWDSCNSNNYTIERASAKQSAISCARFKLGNSWSIRTDMVEGSTPYW